MRRDFDYYERYSNSLHRSVLDKENLKRFFKGGMVFKSGS